MLVWKKVQVSQIDSKAQSSSGGPDAVAVAGHPVVLAAQPGHLRPDRVGGQHGGLAVEGVDLAGDGEVLIGDGAAGDFRIAQGHVQAAVTQHRGDRLQAHAPVDRLGGQRLPELVRMDMRQPGCRRRPC